MTTDSNATRVTVHGTSAARERPSAGSDATRAAVWSAGFALLVSLMLEVWRPLFYLTDDNLTYWLPFATEAYQRLWHGENPLLMQGVFGGAFSLADDPTLFLFTNPLGLLFSWVALTSRYYWLVDLVSISTNLMIAASFAWAAVRMCGLHGVVHERIPVVFLALSYTFTPYNLGVGASWIGFISVQALVPIVVGATTLSRSWHRIALTSASIAFALFGGHPHTFVIFSGVAVLATMLLDLHKRQTTHTRELAVAFALVLLVSAPLLLRTYSGFASSMRSRGLTASAASAFSLHPALLGPSVLAGPALSAYLTAAVPSVAEMPRYIAGFGYSAAVYAAIAGTPGLRRDTPPRRRVVAVLWLICLATAVWVARPDWLASALAGVPILRSLRWPFRELWVFTLAIHAIALLSWRTLSRRESIGLSLAGACGLVPLLLIAPPTFAPYELDRALVRSERAAQYWSGLRPSLGPHARTVTVIPAELLDRGFARIPFSLLGTHNFPQLFGVTSLSGYTFTKGVRRSGSIPAGYHHSGVYESPPLLDAKARENTWIIRLLDVSPVRWSVSRGQERHAFFLDGSGIVHEASSPAQ